MQAKRRRWLLLAGLGLAGGIGAVAAWYPGRPGQPPRAGGLTTCPMHPEVRQSGPGQCPICHMDLVPLAAPAAQLTLDARQTQDLGVRVQAVELRELARPVRVAATVLADERAVSVLHAKVEGWLRQLHVAGLGERVRAGQPLYTLYSPELQQRQREYLESLTRRESLLEGAAGMGGPNGAMLGSLAKERFRLRERLLAADLSPAALEALERSRRVPDTVTVLAPRAGVVSAIGARAGAYVNPMTPVLTLADPGELWAELALAPDQLAWLRQGDTVLLRGPAWPGMVLRARIDLGSLLLDPQTRLGRLRVALAGAPPTLVAGAVLDAEVQAAPRKVAAVPLDAVLRSGHGDRVVLASGPGQFRSVPVTLGLENDTHAELLQGPPVGAQVVVNGQFLLDAAASLQADQARRGGGL